MVNQINYDPENQPGVSNLLTILSTLSGRSIENLVNEFEGQGYGTLKKAVANEVSLLLGDLQVKYKEILASGIIDDVLKEGKEKAGRLAGVKLKEVQKRIGADL
jgi:tryptophanyl-tRNA synthetase